MHLLQTLCFDLQSLLEDLGPDSVELVSPECRQGAVAAESYFCVRTFTSAWPFRLWSWLHTWCHQVQGCPSGSRDRATSMVSEAVGQMLRRCDLLEPTGSMSSRGQRSLSLSGAPQHCREPGMAVRQCLVCTFVQYGACIDLALSTYIGTSLSTDRRIDRHVLLL